MKCKNSLLYMLDLTLTVFIFVTLFCFILCLLYHLVFIVAVTSYNLCPAVIITFLLLFKFYLGYSCCYNLILLFFFLPSLCQFVCLFCPYVCLYLLITFITHMYCFVMCLHLYCTKKEDNRWKVAS